MAPGSQQVSLRPPPKLSSRVRTARISTAERYTPAAGSGDSVPARKRGTGLEQHAEAQRTLSYDTPSYDAYALPPDAVREPPATWGAALRHIGPGLILAGAIVGTGELIATTHLG